MEEQIALNMKRLHDGFKQMQSNMNALESINSSLNTNNRVFYSVLGALKVKQSCRPTPTAPVVDPVPVLSKRNVNKLSTDEMMKENSNFNPVNQIIDTKISATTTQKEQQPSVAKMKTTKTAKNTTTCVQMKQKAAPQWRWKKGVKARIPKKYKTADAIHQLELLLLFIGNAAQGVVLAELVKHCGMSVIKCKEMVEVLIKLDQVTRKLEKKVSHFNIVGSDCYYML